ncbi:hypothetical protein E8E15_000571 [Penicillium rubens]|uniref:Uncharacterized protein n=1 Tax=Penicillium chrysogenum TaxID=5076 RepID=A0ABQ8WEP2_PENCH|nr:hypothetical protein E8E15_000571 [Penicillium rubens]KAJ5265024.1 hypothetical protein N7505_007817 [Penicillium chrysogenum]
MTLNSTTTFLPSIRSTKFPPCPGPPPKGPLPLPPKNKEQNRTSASKVPGLCTPPAQTPLSIGLTMRTESYVGFWKHMAKSAYAAPVTSDSIDLRQTYAGAEDS